jgi:transcriptional regulator with XRE-family HTH domain
MTGAELRKARKRLGMSQLQLAEKLGVQRNSVSRMELRAEVSRLVELSVSYLLLVEKLKKRGK